MGRHRGPDHLGGVSGVSGRRGTVATSRPRGGADGPPPTSAASLVSDATLAPARVSAAPACARARAAALPSAPVAPVIRTDLPATLNRLVTPVSGPFAGPAKPCRRFHGTECLTRIMEKSRRARDGGRPGQAAVSARQEPLTWTFSGR